MAPRSISKTLYDLGPLLRHAGVALLQRGDPFANLQQGLMIGAQETGRQREADRARQMREANRQIAEALFGGPGAAPAQSTVPGPQQPGLQTRGLVPSMAPPGMMPPVDGMGVGGAGAPGAVASPGAPAQPAPGGSGLLGGVLGAAGQAAPSTNPFDAYPQDLRDAMRATVEAYGPQGLGALSSLGLGKTALKPQLTEGADGRKYWVMPGRGAVPAIPGEVPPQNIQFIRGENGSIFGGDPRTGQIQQLRKGSAAATADMQLIQGKDGSLYRFNKRTGDYAVVKEGEPEKQKPAAFGERQRLQAAEGAMRQVNELDGLLGRGFDPSNPLDPEWALNYTTVTRAWNDDQFKEFQALTFDVLDKINFSRSGAAMTEMEAEARRRAFMPERGDSAQVVQRKFRNMWEWAADQVAASIQEVDGPNMTNLRARELMRKINLRIMSFGGSPRYFDFAGLRQGDYPAGTRTPSTPPIPQTRPGAGTQPRDIRNTQRQFESLRRTRDGKVNPADLLPFLSPER